MNINKTVSRASLERTFSQQIKNYTNKEVESFTNDYETVLGRGAYGIVYKGSINDMNIAVKKYHKESEGPLLKEISSLLKFKHPNIVPIYGICFENEVCLILEYMSQGSLQDYINQNEGCVKLNELRILEILIELSEALGYFHSQRLYHRDIKPGNILFDNYGRPKFSDFNHSVFYEDQKSVYSGSDSIVAGTNIYSDPSLKEENEIGYFVDMYSFGITMIVLLNETKGSDVLGILGRARKIVEKGDGHDLKIFLRKDWNYEVGMRLLSCSIDCTKPNKRDRMTAAMLSERLKEYKMIFIKIAVFVDNKELDFIKAPKAFKVKYDVVCDKLKEIHFQERDNNEEQNINDDEIKRLLQDNLEKHDLIERKENNIIENQKKIESLELYIKEQDDNVSNLINEISMLKEKLKETEDQVNSGITPIKGELYSTIESFYVSSLNPEGLSIIEKESCFIIQLRNHFSYNTFFNVLKGEKSLGGIFQPFHVIFNELLIPIDKSKGIYKIVDMEEIMKEFNLVLKSCSKITFCNINTWYISENISIENDLIIESHNKTLIKIDSNKHIKIKGDIKVELNNFCMHNCQNNNKNPFIEICNKSNMIIRNGSFKNNTGLKSLICIGEASSLEIIDTNFEGNKNTDEYYTSACLKALPDSNLKLAKCKFDNYNGSLNERNKYSNKVIKSQGNVCIIDCNFENNINDISGESLIGFHGNSNILMVMNSSFKKCGRILISGNTTATLNNCLFQNNGHMTYDGGALYISGNSKIDMIKCYFIDNKGGCGGSIYCNDFSKLYMKSCRYDRNQAKNEENISDGGAIYLNYQSFLKMDDCVFKKNVSLRHGGGIYIGTESCAEIKNCVFEENSCSSDRGNNIYTEYNAHVKKLTNNQFIDYDKILDPLSVYFENPSWIEQC